jgi:hypothetical protein
MRKGLFSASSAKLEFNLVDENNRRQEVPGKEYKEKLKE